MLSQSQHRRLIINISCKHISWHKKCFTRLNKYKALINHKNVNYWRIIF